MLGHLFHLMDIVKDREMNQFAKEARMIGKGKFKFAWVFDEMEDERERGMTIDTNERIIEFKDRRINFVDTPGHKDYIFNMMKGASQVDLGILLIDASGYGFETGMNKGQTKQHIDILRGMGIKNVIIGVNKMDTCDWKKEYFEYIKHHMANYFIQEGFENADEFVYIPMSAYQGDNLTSNMELSYYKSGSLLANLKKYDLKNTGQSEGVQKPIRLTIKNVFRNPRGNRQGKYIEVKVEGGTVQKSTKLQVMPGMMFFSVKGLYINEKAVKSAKCGDVVEMTLNMDKDEDFESLSKGQIGTDPYASNSPIQTEI